MDSVGMENTGVEIARDLAEIQEYARRLRVLLRHASGPRSFGHWSPEFRKTVDEELKRGDKLLGKAPTMKGETTVTRWFSIRLRS